MASSGEGGGPGKLPITAWGRSEGPNSPGGEQRLPSLFYAGPGNSGLTNSGVNVNRAGLGQYSRDLVEQDGFRGESRIRTLKAEIAANRSHFEQDMMVGGFRNALCAVLIVDARIHGVRTSHEQIMGLFVRTM